MNIDKIREYIVLVNAGSGCIFQPEDATYAYVLSAKHNISNNDDKITDLVRFVLQNGSWQEIAVDVFPGEAYYFPHPEKDIAIIKIARVSGLDKIIRLDDLENDRTGFSLCGYPTARRKHPNPYRIDENFTILETGANQLREGQIPNNPTIDEV